MVDTGNSQDYLKFEADKDIKKIIRDEKLLYSDKITKVNRYGMSQERNILITNKAIYNLKKKELKRRIDIATLKGITCSSITEEFVVHGMDLEYDYNYISSKRKIIVKAIAESYFLVKNTDLLFCELKIKTLKDYVTLKSEKNKDLSYSRMSEIGLIPIKNYYTPQISSTSENTINLNTVKNDDSTINTKRKDVKDVNLSDFKQIKVLGKGSFGKVTLVEHVRANELYAMKSLNKDLLIEEDQINNTLVEKEILQKLKHPFLVELAFCFQTEEKIYFLMPFLNGGELFQHLRKYRVFEEDL